MSTGNITLFVYEIEPRKPAYIALPYVTLARWRTMEDASDASKSPNRAPRNKDGTWVNAWSEWMIVTLVNGVECLLLPEDAKRFELELLHYHEMIASSPRYR